MKILIYNVDGSIRWDLGISEVKKGLFHVYPSDELFNSDSWESGKTIGEALDNFLKVEKGLIDSLMSKP